LQIYKIYSLYKYKIVGFMLLQFK